MIDSNTVVGLVRRSPTSRDAYGNDVFTETVVTFSGVFDPGTSSEAAALGQDQTVTAPTVYLPTGTDVSAIDAVIPQVVVDAFGIAVLDGDGHVQGERYEVDGQPIAWPAMAGWQPPFSVVVRLKRAVA